MTVNSNCQTSCKAMKLFFSSAVDSKIFIVKWWSTFVLLQALQNRPNWWNANKMLGIIKVYGWGEKRSTRVENSALTQLYSLINPRYINHSIKQSINQSEFYICLTKYQYNGPGQHLPETLQQKVLRRASIRQLVTLEKDWWAKLTVYVWPTSNF